jgi:hypothetical protein
MIKSREQDGWGIQCIWGRKEIHNGVLVGKPEEITWKA